jgi:hypothetical protein
MSESRVEVNVLGDIKYEQGKYLTKRLRAAAPKTKEHLLVVGEIKRRCDLVDEVIPRFSTMISMGEKLCRYIAGIAGSKDQRKLIKRYLKAYKKISWAVEGLKG